MQQRESDSPATRISRLLDELDTNKSGRELREIAAEIKKEVKRLVEKEQEQESPRH